MCVWLPMTRIFRLYCLASLRISRSRRRNQSIRGGTLRVTFHLEGSGCLIMLLAIWCILKESETWIPSNFKNHLWRRIGRIKLYTHNTESGVTQAHSPPTLTVNIIRIGQAEVCYSLAMLFFEGSTCLHFSSLISKLLISYIITTVFVKAWDIRHDLIAISFKCLCLIVPFEWKLNLCMTVPFK